jgi:hypothetical protein
LLGKVQVFRSALPYAGDIIVAQDGDSDKKVLNGNDDARVASFETIRRPTRFDIFV